MSLSPIGGGLDPLAWAKFPRSANALDYVIQASKTGDERFVETLAGHVRDGVCSASGKMLRRWDSGQWVMA